MIWVILFAINIAQGIFLLPLLIVRGNRNRIASRLMMVMILLMMVTNISYLVIRTDLVDYIPQFYGLPFGMFFLFGPLFYFYSKSVIDPSFSWNQKYWLHFVPYFISVLYTARLLAYEKSFWLDFINEFLTGNLQIRPIEKFRLTIMYLHMIIYLFFTIRWLLAARENKSNVQYLIPVSSRIKWLSSLTICFALFFANAVATCIYILYKGRYEPVTNYSNTLASSCIIYFIAYSVVLNDELVSPDFTRKYRTAQQLSAEAGEAHLFKLKTLMVEGKFYMDPDLKLQSLANEMNLPPHMVSQLINERFGKNFNDFVNEYRVAEFISRMAQPQYKSLTLFGIAMEVGFSSKSSFNAAFKKVTGKNPSDYKVEG